MVESQYEERTIKVNRVAKVVKGGRRFSFTALMVIGDGNGRVGLGYGKAKEAGLAVQKGIEEARKNMFDVPLAGSTIIHPVLGHAGAGRIMLKPAAPGTGVIAGGAARAILEMAGIRDVVAKSLGTSNAINVAHATIAGLTSLRRPDEIARLRGKTPDEVTPTGVLRAYDERRRLGRAAGEAAEHGYSPQFQVRCPQGRDATRRHPGQVRDRHQAQAPRHFAGARARTDREVEQPPRPAGDSGHDRPRPSSRHRRLGGDEPMKLHDLAPAPGPIAPSGGSVVASAARAGRPPAAAPRGRRPGNNIKPGFEGGQLPLTQRIPKLRGFANPFRVEYNVVNLDVLDELGRRRDHA